ncbi:MAG: phosphatidate cytidylyltransferase [Actinomycetota bacterium]
MAGAPEAGAGDDGGASRVRRAPRMGRSLLQAAASAGALLVLVAVAYRLGSFPFFLLVCVVVLAALAELLGALRAGGRRPVVAWGLVCASALLFAAYSQRTSLIVVAVAATAAGSLLLALRPGRGATPASDAAWTLLSVAWIGGGGAAATYILHLEPDGSSLLIAFIVVVALDDTTAFIAGFLFGRHKMAPSISPGKSWEGFAAGLVVAVLGGAAGGVLPTGLEWLQGAGMGLVIGLAAPVGDLAESLVKRELELKDSGRWLPGHGGFLDRLDAMIFCAPLVLIYLRLFAA